MTSSEPDRSASRRSLLRKAAVTGGAAVAATAVTAAHASPAAADPGDPVLLGLPNTGGTTTVTSTAPNGGATLAVQNSTGATLELKRGTTTTPTLPGSLWSTASGVGVSGATGSSTLGRYEVLTTANASMLVPIPATRVLDSRSAAGRARLLEGAGRIDSTGRVVADSFLVVHLAGIAEYAQGMLGNVTVANTAKGGFITVWGWGDLPNASTINWWTSGQLLSNGVITELGAYETAAGDYYPDVVGIYVQKSATAVILDVTGLLVAHPDSAVINSTRSDARTSLAAESGTREVRAQEIKANAERNEPRVGTGA